MKRTVFQIILMALLVVAVGCENDPATVVTPSSVLTFSPDKARTGYTDVAYLTLEFLDSLEYEEFSGYIIPGQGALLIGVMMTWPGGGDFAIDIKPDALPGDFTYPEKFSMRIPTYQSYLDNPELPLLIRLEPSGINFLVPLTVMGTYMPWTGVTADDLFEYFCLTPELQYFGQPTISEVDNKVQVKFQAPHFSNWGVDRGVDKEPKKPE